LDIAFSVSQDGSIVSRCIAVRVGEKICGVVGLGMDMLTEFDEYRALGTPMDWEEAREHADQVRRLGIQVHCLWLYVLHSP